MSLTVETKIGKKYAIYLPKAIVNALSLEEGEKVLMRVAGNTLLIESAHDPIRLALSGRKFASITPEKVEAISFEEQAKRTKGPT